MSRVNFSYSLHLAFCKDILYFKHNTEKIQLDSVFSIKNNQVIQIKENIPKQNTDLYKT